MSKKKQPSEIDDLFLLIDKDLIKKDSIFVLDSGRLVFCNDYEMSKSSKTNPSRVGEIYGNIQIYYKRFLEFNKGFRFWLLCFCWHRFKSGSNIGSDTFATLKYREYGFEMRLLFPNYIEMIRHANPEENRLRLKQLQLQFLKPKKKK